MHGRKDLKKADALENDYPEAWIELGNVYYHTGRFNDAECLLEKATGANSRYDRAYYFLALIKFRQYRLSEAKQAIGRAVEIVPANADYLFLQGSILSEMGAIKNLFRLTNKP